jgi:aminoglycoside phosphotransferase (APT) family kinase protein
MTHRWKQTIIIDEKIAHEVIEAQFDLQVKNIKLVDSGWDNTVYLINEALIFRFPRREFALPCMTNEIAMLPYIAEQVTFPLSAPQWIGKPSEQYPYPFAGYPMLVGRSLCDVSESLIDNKVFAETLAIWLKELHHVSVRNSDLQLLKNTQDWHLDVAYRVKRCHENLAQYEDYFLEANFTIEQLHETIDKLSQLKINKYLQSYVHGDLYHRHIIVDPNTCMPTGIIDWGDVHISHPGIDLSVGMIFTHSAYEHFLNIYGDVDTETLAISYINGFAHAMSFLPYAYEQNKEPLKRWGRFQVMRAMEEIL